METYYYLTFLLYLLIIASDAVADSYNYKEKNTTDIKKKNHYSTMRHAFEVLLLVLFMFGTMSIPVLSGGDIDISMKYIGILILSFACMRFGIFDILYNKLIGQGAMYIGSTSSIDILLGRIFRTYNLSLILLALRVAVFCFGIFLLQYVTGY